MPRSRYQQLSGYAEFLVKIFPVANLSLYERGLLYQFAAMPAVQISYRDSQKDLNLPDILNVSEEDKLQAFPEALSNLVELGWLKRSNYGFLVHNLIQEVVLFIEGTHVEYCGNIISHIGNRLDKAFIKDKISGMAFLPFAQRIYDVFELVPNVPLGSLYNNAAVIYEDAMGDYQQSLAYNYRAIDIYKKMQEEFELSISYNSLATTYRLLGDYEKALAYAIQSMTIREAYKETKLAYLGNTYQTISIIYRKIGDIEKALDFALKAIEVRKKLSADPEKDKRIAMLYNNISIVYRSIDEYEKAISYAEKALKIKELYFSEDEMSLSTSYGSLAITYFQAGKIKKGYECALKDLDISERVLDAHHPFLAVTYNNLTCFNYHFKNYELAHFYNEKELEVLRANFEEGHSDYESALGLKRKIEEQLKIKNAKNDAR